MQNLWIVGGLGLSGHIQPRSRPHLIGLQDFKGSGGKGINQRAADRRSLFGTCLSLRRVAREQRERERERGGGGFAARLV